MAKVRESIRLVTLERTVESVLNKGIMIDTWSDVWVIGLKLVGIEARVLVASLETYLSYADGVGETIALSQSAGLAEAISP